MLRGKRHFIPLLAVLLVLGACQSEGKLTGEVFIVTEGRENIEMGLVDVKAFKASSLEENLEKRHRQSMNAVQSQAQRAASLLDSMVLGQKKLRERKDQYDEAQAKYNEVFEEYLARLEGYDTSLQSSPGDIVAVTEGNEVPLRSKALRSSKRVESMSEGELGRVLEVEEKEINIFYKIETNKGGVGWTALVTKFVEPEREVVSLKNKTEKALRDAKKLRRQAKVTMSSLSNRLRGIFTKIIPYRRQKYYYENMPQAADLDETGSDGNYGLTVEGGVPYYIVAQSSRSVGNEEEKYYWMVKTTVDEGGEKELNLTNENLGGVADKKYALNERTLSVVEEIWDSAVSLAKEGEEVEWEKLIYRTAFPQDTTGTPIPDDLDVPEQKLLSGR